MSASASEPHYSYAAHDSPRPPLLKTPKYDTKGRSRSRKRSHNRKKNEVRKEPGLLCKFYMRGKCHKGSSCTYSHSAIPHRIMEVCKFYLTDRCAKQEKCLYMHSEFPCKFYHMGLKCYSGSKCKFSHSGLSDATREVLLKHLVTAPTRLLQDFPRLSREGALTMMSSVSRQIPSLLDIEVPIPIQLRTGHTNYSLEHLDETNLSHMCPGASDCKGNGDDCGNGSVPRDAKQSTTGAEPSNPHPDECKSELQFYREICNNGQGQPCNQNSLGMDKEATSEVNVLRCSRTSTIEQHSRASIMADLANEEYLEANGTSLKFMNVCIDTKPKSPRARAKEAGTPAGENVEKSERDEIPLHLPKKQRELYQRIKQQQREVHVNLDMRGDDDASQDDSWYSSDEEEENLTDVLKKICQQGQPTHLQPGLATGVGDWLHADICDVFNKMVPGAQCVEETSIDNGVSPTHNVSPSKGNIPTVYSAAGNTVCGTCCDLHIFETSVHRSQSDIDLLLCTEMVPSESSSQKSCKTSIGVHAPFKLTPVHVPAAEIDASLRSHVPMTYKIVMVDVPTPNYSNFKGTLADQQLHQDPRLRRIFKLGPSSSTSPLKRFSCSSQSVEIQPDNHVISAETAQARSFVPAGAAPTAISCSMMKCYKQ